jgi:hypothetical protein
MAALFCGCPGSHGADSSGTGQSIPKMGSISEQFVPSAVAQAICNKVTQCGCEWSRSAPCQNDGFCSLSECLTEYAAGYRAADAEALRQGAVYDPQGARRCIDAIAAADCGDVDYVNLCTVIWNGTRKIGESCNGTQRCKSTSDAPAECDATGTCAAPSAPSEDAGPLQGGACSGTCRGFACVVLAGAPGGQCQYNRGLTCLSGTCQPLPTQGQACTDKFQCTDPFACNMRVCSARLTDGSPCELAANDNPCQKGSGCVAGVCTGLKANAEACTASEECLETNCVAGKCASTNAEPICGS